MTTADDAGRWPSVITRATALDDLSVRPGRITCDTCGRDATGRIIDAYAGVFSQEAEITDGGGHYIEEIDPSAWTRRLDHLSRSRLGLRDVGVFYHHGMTLYSTPSEIGAHPVGHPMAIRADNHGLLTATHYGTSDHAVRTFTDLTDGNVTGHSWTGRIIQSDPPRIPRAARGGSLPKVRRTELGLAEYGPTPLPFYSGAVLVGQRAAQFGGADPGEETGGGQQPDDDGGAGPVNESTAEVAADIRRRARIALLTGPLR